MITFEKARDWCITAHGNQKYAEIFDYSYHLDAAVEVAIRFGITNIRILLAILGHDVVEDTRRKLWEMLLAGFPLSSLRMISLVTDKPGATREERKARTLPGIRQDYDAIIVKLCDRIANVEFSIRMHDPKFKRHVAEYTFFRACLYDPNHLQARKMWQHLDMLLGWKPQ
jgi:(p)ppGpp synthase/HD superfamily hydrolase